MWPKLHFVLIEKWCCFWHHHDCCGNHLGCPVIRNEPETLWQKVWWLLQVGVKVSAVIHPLSDWQQCASKRTPWVHLLHSYLIMNSTNTGEAWRVWLKISYLQFSQGFYTPILLSKLLRTISLAMLEVSRWWDNRLPKKTGRDPTKQILESVPLCHI